jgi:hypothetical protein
MGWTTSRLADVLSPCSSSCAPPSIDGPKAGARPFHCQPDRQSRRGGQQRFVYTKRVSCRVSAFPSVNSLHRDNKDLTPARKTAQTDGALHIAILVLNSGCTCRNGGCTVRIAGCTPIGWGSLDVIGRCCSRAANRRLSAAAVLVHGEAFLLVLPRLGSGAIKHRPRATPDHCPLSSEAGRCGARQAARPVSATRSLGPSLDPSLPLRAMADRNAWLRAMRDPCPPLLRGWSLRSASSCQARFRHAEPRPFA